MDRNSSGPCSVDDVAIFSKHVSGQLLQVNALMAMNSILILVMVGIGAYGHRYRHHPLTRCLFTCATTLFLPVVSYVVSTVNSQNFIGVRSAGNIIVAVCNTYKIEILVWTALVQIVGINTITIVASDAREEGRNIAPPTVLLVQVIWTSYLAATVAVNRMIVLLVLPPFALIFAKLILKYYAWSKARRSLGLGRNPRLIVGYMERLQDSTTGRHSSELTSEQQNIPPPLIVSGEDTVLAEMQPRGYNFRWMLSNTGDRTRIINNLVTIDRVWQLDDALLRSTTQLKDLCFSFALFKLLRCRFARYTAVEAGFTKARNFLRHVLLEERGDDYERVFLMVADELSFLQDYYYSSLPMSYSKSCLPIMSIFLSLSSIGYCLFAVNHFASTQREDRTQGQRPWQMVCSVQCNTISSEDNTSRIATCFGTRYFGDAYFVVLLLYLLYALVVLAEAREIVSYICSNWTKVALICHYVNHASSSWQRSLAMQKCIIARLLQFRCKMLRNWEDKMNQCSIRVVHPRKTDPVSLLRRLVHLPVQNNKIPRAVKAAVIDALRRCEGSPRNIELQAGDNILWTLNGTEGTANTILVCHIATSVVEARSHPHHQSLSCDDHDNKIAAIHLSRYCAYLVAYCPNLLPDDDKWCKSLYKTVKEDADRVLAGGIIGVSTSPEVEYEKLVGRLRAGPNHEVLKNGAEVGKRLAELVEGDQETAWKVLARFWSEMILYVAPSDNINGHAEAIARGGELITLMWALLTHLGIVSRTIHDTVTVAADAAHAAV